MTRQEIMRLMAVKRARKGVLLMRTEIGTVHARIHLARMRLALLTGGES